MSDVTRLGRHAGTAALAALASLVALTLGVSASAATSSAPAAAGVGPELEADPVTFRDSRFAVIEIGDLITDGQPATARVEIRVPTGYAIDLTRPPGTTIGHAAVQVVEASGTSRPGVTFTERPTVADPAAYVADAASQACAPGVHAAVWHIWVTARGQRLSLPLFVDPVSTGPDAYAIQFCPLWPPAPERPTGLTALWLLFMVEGVARPTVSSVYTWSAFLTPAAAGSFSADPTKTFEIRALVPIPQKLTLRARYDAKTKSALLGGRFTVRGKPQKGVKVRFEAWTEGGEVAFPLFGPARTNARGEFSIRRRIDRTTRFIASVRLSPRPCIAPSSAPAGCRSETVAEPVPAVATAMVPRVSS